jgi:hypothetical protein
MHCGYCETLVAAKSDNIVSSGNSLPLLAPARDVVSNSGWPVTLGGVCYQPTRIEGGALCPGHSTIT